MRIILTSIPTWIVHTTTRIAYHVVREKPFTSDPSSSSFPFIVHCHRTPSSLIVIIIIILHMIICDYYLYLMWSHWGVGYSSVCLHLHLGFDLICLIGLVLFLLSNPVNDSPSDIFSMWYLWIMVCGVNDLVVIIDQLCFSTFFIFPNYLTKYIWPRRISFAPSCVTIGLDSTTLQLFGLLFNRPDWLWKLTQFQVYWIVRDPLEILETDDRWLWKACQVPDLLSRWR